MATALLAALQALQLSLRDVAARKQAALELMHRDPAQALGLHQALLDDVPALQAETDGVVALWDADPVAQQNLPGLRDWLSGELRSHQAGIELSMAMGHQRAGNSAQCAEHLPRYLALSAGQPDPARTMALELLARLDLEAGRPDRAGEHATALEAEAMRWTQPEAWQGVVPPGDEAAMANAAWRQVSAGKALRADLALAEGRRDAYLQLNREAQELADRAGAVDAVRTLWWARTSCELVWDASGERLDSAEADVRGSAPEAVRTQPDFQRRLLQTRAQVWAQRGRSERAIGLLQNALTQPGANDPAAGWTLHLDLADLFSGQGRHDEALQEAEAALADARQLQSATVLRQCLDRRRGLRQAAGDPVAMEAALIELDAEATANEPAADRATRLQTRAMLLLALKRHDQALNTLDALQALPPAAREMAAVSPAQLAGLRAAVLRDGGRVPEAVAVLEAAAHALERDIGHSGSSGGSGSGSGSGSSSSGGSGPGGHWRDRESYWQTFTLGAALNHAELGHAEAAVQWAERGREHLWGAALRRHGRTVGPVQVGRLRRELAERQTAAVVLMVGRQRTLAVLLPADGGEPQTHRIGVGLADWRARLDALDSGAAQWNPRFVANLDDFSVWLGPLLADAVQGAQRLVVVPEGLLALVPFAGLKLPTGERLAQRVATVLVPTLAFGARSAGPQGPQEPLQLLSAGAGTSGSAETGAASGAVPLHDFSAMACEVAAHYARGPATALPDATRTGFLAAAAGHKVLHLSFHGNVQPGRLDPLAASTLEFHGGERLSARQLLEAWPAGNHFEVVFLNACVSAGFAFDRDAGAGGFMQAFLEAGARQLVATLAYVDPAQAQSLALGFHRAWRDGVDVAGALQAAQIESIAAGAPPEAWATHLAVAAGF